MARRQRPIAIDLFAGAGGMALGFEQAGFDVVAATDIDPVHCAVYEYNFPSWSVICADARQIHGSDILARADAPRGRIDVVFGGPPCEGFSVIGKRDLDDPRNALVFHFMRLVLEIQPNYFVMENVPGLMAGTHREFLHEIMARFTSNGYAVNCQVLNAAEFGVPQARKRVFVMGCRLGLDLPSFPTRTHAPSDGCHTGAATRKTPTVWDAIGDLPEVEAYPELLERDWIRVKLGKGSRYARMCRTLDSDPADFSYPRKYDRSILTGMQRVQHRADTIRRFKNTAWGEKELKGKLKRLDPNGLCNTLRAGTPSDRGSHSAARPIHPHSPRYITVREGARLHSYPDWFHFHRTKWHGFRQVGNSVPPLLARAIASQVVSALGVRPRKPRKDITLREDSALLSLNMSEAAVRFAVDRRVIAPRKRH